MVLGASQIKYGYEAFCAIALIAWCCCGCTERGTDEVSAAKNRLHVIYGGITTAALEDKARGTNLTIEALPEVARREPLLREALTKRTGGSTSFALVSTNVNAWRNPLDAAYGQEIAVILPDHIQKNSQPIYIGIRFNGQLVYFTSLSPGK